MDPEISSRLSSRTHLAETCRDCGGDGCGECGWSGRVVRFTHDPRSDNTQDDADAELAEKDLRIAQLEVELGMVTRERNDLSGCFKMRGVADTPTCGRCVGCLKARVEACELGRSALLDAARRAKDALEAREFVLGPGGVVCIRCKSAPDEKHNPATCEVADALSALSAVLGGEPSKKPGEMGDRRALAERVREDAARLAEMYGRLWGSSAPSGTQAPGPTIADAIRSIDLEPLLGGGS